MAAARKRRAQRSRTDEIAEETADQLGSLWVDEVHLTRPLSARSDLSDFDATTEAANDDAPRSGPRIRPGFVGSRHFWAALIVSFGSCLILALFAGYASRGSLAALLRDPSQHATLLIALCAVLALQWGLALSAHRQAVTEAMWRHLLTNARQPPEFDGRALREAAASLESLFADLDARTLEIDERMKHLSRHTDASIRQLFDAAEVNALKMRDIIDASAAQLEGLQRAGVMIATDVVPVVKQLEGATTALDSVSQRVSTTIEGVGERIEQSKLEMRHCLEALSRTDFSVAPEIERRMVRLEAMISRLPVQLDAAVDRISPLCDTITQASMLSAANVAVLEQCAEDVSVGVGNCSDMLRNLSESGSRTMREAISEHSEHFRTLLQNVVREEAVRVSELSCEISNLADTASGVIERLRQPVSEVNSVAELALFEMSQSMTDFEERVRGKLSVCVTEMNSAAARLVNAVGGEIETSATALQSRIAANSADIVQRFSADTSRLERTIADATDRTAGRVAAVIRELPTALAQRLETEVGRIDCSLRNSVVNLSDQLLQALDGAQGRLSEVARDTASALEEAMENSVSTVAGRTGQISEQFRRSATETAEVVLESYVDFIFLAVERLRSEMGGMKVIDSREIEIPGAPNSSANETPIADDAASSSQLNERSL